MDKRILIWGYLASFTLLLGAIFLNHNFILGKILYLVGFVAFNIGYLIPLFYVIFKENQENQIGLVLVFGIVGFITFLTGVSFFVVNWGGGIVLIYVGAGILILAILTIIAFSRRFYETHIDSWFPVLVFGVFIVGSLLIGMVHRQVMRAFTIRNIESVEMYQLFNGKNKILYNQLINIDTAKFTNHEISINSVVQLKNETKTLVDFIENLKINLVKEVEGDAYKMFDGRMLLNLVPIQSNVEINSVSRFMLKKNMGKAYELKDNIENYKKIILVLIPEKDSLLNQIVELNLKTESLNYKHTNSNTSWEHQKFYDLPLITVLGELSHLQLKITMVECEVLNYYYNSLNDRFAINNK